MTKVYGYSDDLVEIETTGDDSAEEDEIGCYNNDVIIYFDDGTIITIGYGKQNKGIWYVLIENQGTAEQELEICNNEDDDIYSDTFTIKASIVKYEKVKREEN